MKIAILSNIDLKDELLVNNKTFDEFIWVNDFNEFSAYTEADVFIDLLFENKKERVEVLQKLLPKIVIVNSVIDTLSHINPQFIRINGWPTFLTSAIVEGSGLNNDFKPRAEEAFKQLGKQIEWLQDDPGFITPRIISMIINEAFFALQEGVSTPAEINTAMKLGTAYPYGPFEWAEKIGVQNIVSLLQTLSHQQQRYTPCELLVQETDKSI